MKILVATHYFSTHAGGIEIVAGALASHLAASHEVAWAASDCDPVPTGIDGVRFLPMRSLNIVEQLTGLPFPLWGPGSLARVCREVASSDIVHLHDAAYFGNWAAFVCARWHRKPVLITQHAGLIRYRNPMLRVALRAMHRTAVRALLGRADRVIFVSPVVQTYFSQFVAFRQEPAIVWNGVDTSTYRPATADERAQARERFGFGPAEPVVLFVGRFVEAKGLPIIEQLARRLPDVTFALAGWGPIDPRTWHAPNVRVFDSLRGATLVPLYQAANLLILPSLGEGLPLVVQEALACGTPALVDSETAKAIDAPADAVSGYAVGGPDAVNRWAAAIRQMAGEQTSAEARAILGRFARERWSWQTCSARYSEVFETLTGPTRPAVSPER